MCIIVIVAVKIAMLFASRSDPLLVVVVVELEPVGCWSSTGGLFAVVKLNAEEGKTTEAYQTTNTLK